MNRAPGYYQKARSKGPGKRKQGGPRPWSNTSQSSDFTTTAVVATSPHLHKPKTKKPKYGR